MCRVLLANRPERFNAGEVLSAFADMCELSRTPEDNDWQGDGWGVSWLNEDDNWQTLKSTMPIWEDKNRFDEVGLSKTFISHARSKSFEHNELNIDHNQPYTDNDLAYVFNGVMRGVALKAEGEIGAQKVFNILKKYRKNRSLVEAMAKLRDQINIATKELVATNIIATDKKIASVLCNHWGKTSDYHSINYSLTESENIICSESLDLKDRSWSKMQNQQILSFNLL